MMNTSRLLKYPARFALLAVATLLVAPGSSGVAFAAQPVAKNYRVLVTNERSGTLTVIDGVSRKVISTVPLGKRPRGLKLSPDGKLLYVALSGSPIAGPGVDASKLPPADKGADGIGVVDVATLKLVNILRGVSDPEQLAVSSDGKRLYIASEDTGSAIVLDAVTGKTLANLAVGGEPEGVTLSPNGRFVYVSSEEDHKITVIDTTTSKQVATFNVGQRPRFTEFSDDGSLAFVSAENDGTITVADARTHKVLRTIKLAGELTRPVGMAISHDGKRLYTVTGRAKNLLSVEIATGKVLGTVEVGARPWGVAISPDGATLFTANGSSNDVTVVDAASMKVVSKIPAGDSPWGLIVVPTPSGK
jgi:YVTN family beta-propeller protein